MVLQEAKRPRWLLFVGLVIALALAPWRDAVAQDSFDLPIRKVDCTSAPGPAEVRDFALLGEIPGGCSLAAGVAFTVTAEDGTPFGSCVLDADGVCTVPVPVPSTVIVTEDVSTAALGYEPRENPVTVVVEPASEASAVFINLPARLPDAGVGTTMDRSERGRLLFVAALLVLAIAGGRAWRSLPR